MSQSYYLWTSYKGIVNVCDTPDPVTSTVTKYVNFLYRGDGDGNQKQFTGKIGHTTYTNFEVLEEDYFNDDTYGVPEGRFICNFPSANDAAAQNLTGGATSYRVSMDSFHDKTGLTDEEKNNF